MSDIDVDEVRDALRREKGDLSDMIANLGYSNLLQPGTAMRDHPAEDATDIQNHEQAVTQANVLRGKLAKVVSALARLEAGVYGICEECGSEIAPERIEANLCVTDCFECASQRCRR